MKDCPVCFIPMDEINNHDRDYGRDQHYAKHKGQRKKRGLMGMLEEIFD